MVEKVYLDANQLLDDAFLLGSKILDSEFFPDLLIGVWRGGTPIAIAVHELLRYQGLALDHIPIRTSLYSGTGECHEKVEVHGLSYVGQQRKKIQRILIVDDVFDSGLTIKQVMYDIAALTKGESIDVRVAVPWFKPENNKTEYIPDYFLYTTEAWLVFPHELCGLSQEEILAHKPSVGKIIL